MSHVALSLIVCTYNRSRLLDRCLNSIAVQDRPEIAYEVIIVDNNSTDDTSVLVAGYVERFPCFFYVKEENQGLSHARNKGCEVARGLYLAYLDDDATIPQGYLTSVAKIIQAQQPDILGGPIYPYYDSPKPNWFKDKYEIRKFADHSGFSSKCRISGGNFIIRRNLLMDLGGFDVNLGMKGSQIGLGEERAVLEGYRKRIPTEHQKVYYSLECSVLHYVPEYKMKRRYMLKRSYQAGRIGARIKKKEPSSVFRRMKSFFPDLFAMLAKTIRKDGFLRADYASVLFEAALKIGNIIELLSRGWGPVLKPHLRVHYGRIRAAAKKLGLKRQLIWFENRIGIKW